MFGSSWRALSLTGTGTLLVLAACGGGDSTQPDPNPTPTVSLSVAPAAVSVAAGASATVTATIVRGGGFTGAVTISGSGAPAGITISGGTIAAGVTSMDVTIASTAAAAAGASTLSISGSATGVSITPKPVALTVTAASQSPAGQIGVALVGEASGDQFGLSVALSANGTRLIVGAPYNDGSGSDAGHARVFDRMGDSWVQAGSDLDGEAAGDEYGTSVAISDDGSRVAVGSYLNDDGGTNAGNVRLFDYAGGSWTQVGGDIDGEFVGQSGRGSGAALAMSASGHRVVIGGPGVGSGFGHVKVYELTGGTWTQVGATFAGNNELGTAVAMSDDGNRVAFSEPSAAGSSLPGSVEVYDWNGTAWTAVGATLSGEAVGDNFGSSLSLSADGNTLAVGAETNVGGGVAGGGAKGGHVRVFHLAGGNWNQVGSDIDGPVGAGFGESVSISADGQRLISTGAGGGKASVGVFNLSGGDWSKPGSPDFGTGGRMGGVAISADGHTVAVGEVYYQSATGAVRLYSVP